MAAGYRLLEIHGSVCVSYHKLGGVTHNNDQEDLRERKEKWQDKKKPPER